MNETLEVQAQLQEKWLIFWWALGMSLVALGIAWRQGLFKPFVASSLPLIQGKDVLKGFGFFLFTQVVWMPALISLIFAFVVKDDVEQFIQLNQQSKGLLNLLIIGGGFGGALLGYRQLTARQRQELWQQTSVPWYVHIGIGCAVWFVCYPVALALSQLISLATWHFFHHAFTEQIVVQHLRTIVSDPLLLGLTALAVTVLVPMTEEFLFRGLLQTWLKHKFHHTTAAIFISSLIFAFFHYSSMQGMANIEILSFLWMLSCVLGFVYERQRSLWAPIGLHGFFNGMSLLMVFKE